MMHVWWCNQGSCWPIERPNGIVCATRKLWQFKKQTEQWELTEPESRRTIADIRAGDIILHYVSKQNKSLLAISQAQMDAAECCVLLTTDGTPAYNCLDYVGSDEWPFVYLVGDKDNTGWIVQTAYHDFQVPIPRDAINTKIMQSQTENCPFNKNGHVKQKYMLRFSRFANDLWGLRIIRQASPEAWPDWAEAALQRSS
jgi:hypothetical protein